MNMKNIINKWKEFIQNNIPHSVKVWVASLLLSTMTIQNCDDKNHSVKHSEIKNIQNIYRNDVTIDKNVINMLLWLKDIPLNYYQPPENATLHFKAVKNDNVTYIYSEGKGDDKIELDIDFNEFTNKINIDISKLQEKSKQKIDYEHINKIIGMLEFIFNRFNNELDSTPRW